MQIVKEEIPIMTIEELADRYGLVMRIRERARPEGSTDRYYATFDNLEISDGFVLIGTFGDGETPEQAITDYTRKLSMKRLVKDAFRNRVEIEPTRLTVGSSRHSVAIGDAENKE